MDEKAVPDVEEATREVRDSEERVAEEGRTLVVEDYVDHDDCVYDVLTFEEIDHLIFGLLQRWL